MAKNSQPIAKRCKTLNVSPSAMGYAKKNTNRNPKGGLRRKQSEYGLQLVGVQGHRIVDEPLQTVGPPLLIIDAGTAVIAVPERLTGGRRGIEVFFQIVIL